MAGAQSRASASGRSGWLTVEPRAEEEARVGRDEPVHVREEVRVCAGARAAAVAGVQQQAGCEAGGSAGPLAHRASP